MADSRHNALVKSITDPIGVLIEKQFKQYGQENAAEFANINTLLGACLARLEAVENSKHFNGGTRRTPRGERKTGGVALKKPTPVKDDGFDMTKVKNAMLFFRMMWTTNSDFRKRYLSKEITAKLETETTVATKGVEGSTSRYSAEGLAVWKMYLTDPQKKDIRDEFSRWKDEVLKQELPDPLTADGGEDDTDSAYCED